MLCYVNVNVNVLYTSESLLGRLARAKLPAWIVWRGSSWVRNWTRRVWNWMPRTRGKPNLNLLDHFCCVHRYLYSNLIIFSDALKPCADESRRFVRRKLFCLQVTLFYPLILLYGILHYIHTQDGTRLSFWTKRTKWPKRRNKLCEDSWRSERVDALVHCVCSCTRIPRVLLSRATRRKRSLRPFKVRVDPIVWM